jgi:hypothetical protein
MKAITIAISGGLAAALWLMLFPQAPPVRSAGNENHCFTCHTNPRKLIEITRELSKRNLETPGASKETTGEG